MEGSRNPYAAPQVAIDPPDEDAIGRRLVRIAVGLYAGQFVLMVGTLPWEMHDPSNTPAVIAGVAVVFGLVGLFTLFIARRLLRRGAHARAWVICTTVLHVLGFVWLVREAEVSWIDAVDVASALTRIAAGVILVLPVVGRWFRAAHAPEGGARA